MRPDLRSPWVWLMGGLVLAALIAWLSLTPSRNLPELGIPDKIKHGLAHLAMALWFGGLVVRREHLRVLVALILFGAAIEGLQHAMGLGRQAEWLDMLANVVGAVAGLLLARTALGDWACLLERGMSAGRRA